MTTCVAVDVGTNGGVVYAGRRDPDGIEFTETYRFDNQPVERGERYVWDVDHIVGEILTGLEETERRVGEVDTVGIDTWGCDFGFVRDGELLRDPYSYRDPDATSTVPEIFEQVTRREVFRSTGITHWHVPNSLFQYHFKYSRDPELFEEADTIVNMPQVFTTTLGGGPRQDPTITSTTQMYDPDEGRWATELLADLDLPTDPLPEVVDPGTSLGTLDEEYASRLTSDPEIVATAGHDTGSAVVGTPLGGDDGRFLSTGSWLLPGVELDEPILSDAALDIDASNEIGVEETIRFLKDVTGFLTLEMCRDAWREAGEEHGYDALLVAARETDPRGPVFDPDADQFASGTLEGDIVENIRAYCCETDQPVPSGTGELTRCVLESLAAKVAYAFDRIDEVAPPTGATLRVVGGGVRNDLFCDLVAATTGRTVVAGPVEATAMGNLLVQLSAAGEIADIAEGRRLLREAVDLRTHEPAGEDWRESVERMTELVES
jgi:rhamnulokinase